MQIVESPSSIGYSEDEQRAMKTQLIFALAGFIAVKVIMTYVINKAAKAVR